MRLLLTTDTVGGVWTFATELTEGLLACGHSVALVTIGKLPSDGQCSWCSATQNGYGAQFAWEALEMPLEWMEENDEAFAAGATSLLEIAERFKADLIHSSQFCFGALATEIPKVVTAHSDVLSWAQACRPGGLADDGWLERYRVLVAGGLIGADAIVAPTQWMRGALQRGFAEANEITVINNGRTISWKDEQAPKKKLQAVSLGRLWDEAKGLSVLEDMPCPMPVVIAGQTSLDQGSNGAMSPEEVLLLLSRSAVYVACSVYEPFGLAPLEAALCGCAVVARDIPSLREVWNNGALYFSSREELQALLDGLATDAAALALAQRKSYARALHFSAARMVDQYLDLYVGLVGPRAAKTSRGSLTYAA